MLKLLKQLRFFMVYSIVVYGALWSVYLFRNDENLLFFWSFIIFPPAFLSTVVAVPIFGYRIQWVNNNSLLTIFFLSILVWIIIFFIGCYRFAFISDCKQFIDELFVNIRCTCISVMLFFIFSVFIKIIQ